MGCNLYAYLHKSSTYEIVPIFRSCWTEGFKKKISLLLICLVQYNISISLLPVPMCNSNSDYDYFSGANHRYVYYSVSTVATSRWFCHSASTDFNTYGQNTQC